MLMAALLRESVVWPPIAGDLASPHYQESIQGLESLSPLHHDEVPTIAYIRQGDYGKVP